MQKCMQTHIQHSDTHITCTQTPPATTCMFPLLSSLILEFITEKTHPCFLLFKPDVSSSSLSLFSFRLVGWPLLSIVLWSGECIFFLRAVYVCACMCPQTKPLFSPFLCSGRRTNTTIFCRTMMPCCEFTSSIRRSFTSFSTSQCYPSKTMNFIIPKGQNRNHFTFRHTMRNLGFSVFHPGVGGCLFKTEAQLHQLFSV